MRIALVVILLLCGVGAYAESQPPPPTTTKTIENHKSNAKQNQKNPRAEHQIGTDTLPFVVKVQSPVTDHPETNKSEEKHNNYKSSEWWLVYLTAALVFVTFGLTIYTARLWRATKVLAKDAKDTADRQTTEMQESLRIAEINARATEKAAEAAKKSADAIPATERAFIFVTVEFKGGNMSTLEDGHHCGTFVAKITNYGKTPALLSKLYFEQVVQADFPAKFTETPDTNFPPGCAIGVGSQELVSCSFKINPADFTKIESNEIKWFCYGRVEYTDVFSNLHKTGFCYEYFRQGSYGGLNITRNNELNYYS